MNCYLCYHCKAHSYELFCDRKKESLPSSIFELETECEDFFPDLKFYRLNQDETGDIPDWITITAQADAQIALSELRDYIF